MTKRCIHCDEVRPIEDFSIKNKKTGNRRTVCRDCRRVQNREWVKRNSDRHREYQREYARSRRLVDEAYAEAKRKSYRQWRSRNIEYDRERQRRYRQENPELFALHAANRRSLKRGAEGSFTLEEWLELCAHHGHLCLACGEDKSLTIDHIVPLSMGGSNNIENVQPLCGPCNSSKGARVIDYRSGEKEGR